jgi:hypothetical protein
MNLNLSSELPFIAPFALVLAVFCGGLVLWIVARIRR